MIIADIKTARGEYQITIDGITYDLTSRGELSLRDHYLIGEAQLRLIELRRIIGQEIPDDASDAEKESMQAQIASAMAEVEKTINICLRPIMAKVPESVYSKLSNTERLRIIEAFQTAMYQERKLKNEDKEEAEAGSPFADGSPS